MDSREVLGCKLKFDAVPDDQPTMGDNREKGKAGLITDDDAAEPDSQEDFCSDSESGSESIEIADLKKRMWKYQLRLMKLESRSGRRDNRGGGGDVVQQKQQLRPDRDQVAAKKEEHEETPEDRYRRKTMLRAQDGVLRHMLKMMEACNARGFVYGVVDEDGVPVSGSSDSLRGWWKDDVGFDRTGPMALLSGSGPAGPGSPMAAAASFLHGLHDIQDSTLGSLLSALIQHCEPPQRSFPLDRGLPPPWWPTGREPWWGLQGEAQAHQGAPPYRKPHDLKKAWKISLLSAVIKHLSPRFDQMRKLVWQSKRLQHKMSARDAETWSRVIAQEEALDRHVQRALHITPLEDDEDDDPPKEEAARAAHLDKRKRRAGGDEDAGASEIPRLALPDIEGVPEVDRNSIDELIKLYYCCLQGTDGEHEKDAPGVIGDEGQSQSSVGETVHDAQLPDDMFDGLPSVADVVDVSDFQNSPIWQWVHD